MIVTQLTKWGNSQGIRINKKTLKSLNLDTKEIENQEIKFEMDIKDGKIILNPIKEITKLDKLFADFEGNSKDHMVSIDWGDSVGNEVW